MVRYLSKVRQELTEITKRGIQVNTLHVPQKINGEADQLAKLATDPEAFFPVGVYYKEISVSTLR